MHAVKWGVDWILYRLAFSEFTRAPVEFHASRPIPYILSDLAALDAAAELREMDRVDAERGKGG